MGSDRKQKGGNERGKSLIEGLTGGEKRGGTKERKGGGKKQDRKK